MKFYLFVFLFSVRALHGLLNTITISGNPSVLLINSAVAGSPPNSVTDSSTTYDCDTLLGTKISGKINTNMPSGVTLEVNLNSTDGTSQGFVTMSTTTKNLVTSIPILTNGSAQTITYRLSATINAAKVTNGSRVLTLTVQ